MIRQTSFIVLALLCATAATATDNRIRKLRYDPNQIVTVAGRAGIQSTIEFGPDEHIESVAVGDSAAWQVTPNRRASLLFVKPMIASSRSNMTVVTDQRTYMFDLVAGRHGGVPLYALKFSYPDGPVSKPKIEQATIVTPTPAPPLPTPAQLNFGWKTKGAANLLPSRVFDDGSTLYIAWATGALLPAVLTLSEDGKEGALDYRVVGDYLVVTPVPGNFVLRYGKRTATASRMAPNTPPVRVDPSLVRPTQEQSDPAALVIASTARPPAGPTTTGPSTVSGPLASDTFPQPVASIGRQQPMSAVKTQPRQHAVLAKKLAYPILDSDQLTDNHHE